MATNLNFSNKNKDDFVGKLENWVSYLTFFKTEIDFLKKIINTYPFSTNARNLFENIQIYSKKLDDFNFNRLLILKKLTLVNQEIKKNKKEKIHKKDSHLTNEFNLLEDEILTFIKSYNNLKNTVYNYVYALLPT
ncbi:MULTISPECIES: hypothetical protein [Flavobacteriaceae]|uniref:Uncharacterized protein n=2 Tax=Flavobacteriaceae TaxID=49546 RepID=A0A4Y8AV39_9FLAO|nr:MULTISPECIES: hypothetical protein [Flavobacteriaceae]TEW76339.1 hypothetical protein E2488_00370 [Gramella jeungdoensis]GGK52057.1 hypothetical protein GCM10007963_20510 [Lutibacter litoralis]